MAFSFRKIISNIVSFNKSDDESDECERNDLSIKLDYDLNNIHSDESTPERIIKSTQKSTTSLSNVVPTDNVSSLEPLKARSLDQINKIGTEVLDDNKMTATELEFVDIFKRSMENLDLYNDDDLKSLPESDSDASVNSTDAVLRKKNLYKLCRKISDEENYETFADSILDRTSSSESFSDLELDRNEEERISVILSYQMKLEKIEYILKKLMTEFKFHIEVSKIFQCKSFLTTLPGADVTNLPKLLEEFTQFDQLQSTESGGTWNLTLQNEDTVSKTKLKKQFNTIKNSIQTFVDVYLDSKQRNKTNKKTAVKRMRVNKRKTQRRLNEFPDLHDTLHNMFSLDNNRTPTDDQVCCHFQRQLSSPDSGNMTKLSSVETITSSLADFSIDTSTITAYSESLDHIITYSSYDDQSVYLKFLVKSAYERITFYMCVHKIKINEDMNDSGRNTLIFTCAACGNVELYSEQELVTHILSQNHCEKLHFLYKTAYIKKCMRNHTEIKPSTVLNPMTMYRDENKIVCFGEGKFACSLCFEPIIIGESLVMKHFSEPDHVERREYLSEILEQ